MYHLANVCSRRTRCLLRLQQRALQPLFRQLFRISF